MLSLTKVNTLFCIALFLNPCALADSVSSASNGVQEEGQENIIAPGKESLKNETGVASSQSTSVTKELKLTQIIIDIDKPGDYVFGIYPNNNKNKNKIDNQDVLRPNGTVTIYDVSNDKLVSEISLKLGGEHLFGNRDIDIDGLLFSTPLKSRSQYLITPKIYVESKVDIDTTYSFLIHRKVFTK